MSYGERDPAGPCIFSRADFFPFCLDLPLTFSSTTLVPSDTSSSPFSWIKNNNKSHQILFAWDVWLKIQNRYGHFFFTAIGNIAAFIFLFKEENNGKEKIIELMWTAPCELFESTLQKTKKKKKKKEIGNFKYKRFMRCQQRPVSAHLVDRDSILIPLYRHLPSHRQSDTQSRRAYDKEVYASFFLRLHFTFSRPQNTTIPFSFPQKMSFTCAHLTSFDFF